MALEPAAAVRHDGVMGAPQPERLSRPEVFPRHRGVRPVFLLALALVMAVSVFVTTRMRSPARVDRATRVDRPTRDWFGDNKAHCNALEVTRFLALHAPPATENAAAQRAACLAIAGKIADARGVIAGLAPVPQNDAVNSLFLLAHPIADAGDDESARPIMELVLEFQPDQYMALYHAGMANAILGNDDQARRYLTRFLVTYRTQDSWFRRAFQALDALRRPAPRRVVEKTADGSIVY